MVRLAARNRRRHARRTACSSLGRFAGPVPSIIGIGTCHPALGDSALLATSAAEEDPPPSSVRLPAVVCSDNIERRLEHGTSGWGGGRSSGRNGLGTWIAVWGRLSKRQLWKLVAAGMCFFTPRKKGIGSSHSAETTLHHHYKNAPRHRSHVIFPTIKSSSCNRRLIRRQKNDAEVAQEEEEVEEEDQQQRGGGS